MRQFGQIEGRLRGAARGANTDMDEKELEKLILDVAREFYDRGPGWAQESVVLREVGKRLGVAQDLDRQQAVLTCWHDLFRDGSLSWGYDLDNPSRPWFHFPQPARVSA